MNNGKVFKILYYLCLIFNIIIFFITFKLVSNVEELTTDLINVSTINILLAIINIILVIIFSISIIKNKKLEKVNILFPILFLIFSIIVTIIEFIFNSRLITPYIHFNYYSCFILFNYILLNIYSVLSISNKN